MAAAAPGADPTRRERGTHPPAAGELRERTVLVGGREAESGQHATGLGLLRTVVPLEAKPEEKKDTSVLKSAPSKTGESGPELGAPGKPATDRPTEAPAAARDSDPTGQPKLDSKKDDYNEIFKDVPTEKSAKPAQESKAG